MKTVVLNQTNQTTCIATACQVLKDGGLIIFPTETTYGAGVDATNPQAVQKLLKYKSRREGKPLSIAVPTQEVAEQYVILNDQARVLYNTFLPGPVTVVSKGKGVLAPGVESEFGTLGVRIPDYEFVIKLLKAYGKPLTATSANGSGKKRPYSIPEVLAGLSKTQQALIDLSIDAGTLPARPPSTVIDTTLSTPVVMRSGPVAMTDHDTHYTVHSHSEDDTYQIAGRLMLKHWEHITKTGLVIGLDGPLGAGKTTYAKGVAKFLGITQTITSPTYSYIEEYPYTRHSTTGWLYHLDMWKVATAQEFARLKVPSLLAPSTVVVIEWWEQVQHYWPECAPIVRVTISPQEGSGRSIQVVE